MLNIILPAVAPSSSTSSDLPVLEADTPPTEANVAFCFRTPSTKVLGPQALCGGASSAWLPSVVNRSVNLLDFQLLLTPCTSPPPGHICCSTDWGNVQGIMALSLLVSELLVESSPSLTSFSSSSALHILFKLTHPPNQGPRH